MKRILITGANSYIGTSFEKYMAQWPDQYRVDTVGMIGDGWKSRSFAGYDVVFHVAGIAHSDHGKITEEKKTLYYKVNTELAVETAKKAKTEGVGHFIFMSSIIVYGDSAPVGKQKIITKDTAPCPVNAYGDSKLRAEMGLVDLDSNDFRICILRPPMVYGKGCKGNYQMLAMMARKLPFFVFIQNQRSAIYVVNLLEFVRWMIRNEECGVFWPQNNQYFSTSEALQRIGAAHGKTIFLLRGFAWALKALGHAVPLIRKAFGNLVYDMDLSKYKENYVLHSFESSIVETEM